MRREAVDAAARLAKQARAAGLRLLHLDGKAYWTEQACYAFTSDEIDQLEAATEELHGLCLKAVEYVVANKLWERMRIPPAWGDYIEQVWRRADPTICGRFDLAYDGKGPPKLLEYNADTPTALYEAAVVQWYWLKDVKPDADQFNSIHEKLIEAWRGILARLPPEALVHFARFEDHPEDLATSEYLRDTALQAGLAGKPIAVPQIGWNGTALHRHRRDADPGDEQALSLGMDGARGVRRPCADRHHGLHRARLEDDPVATRCCCRSCGRAFPATPTCCRPSTPSTPTSAAPM